MRDKAVNVLLVVIDLETGIYVGLRMEHTLLYKLEN